MVQQLHEALDALLLHHTLGLLTSATDHVGQSPGTLQLQVGLPGVHHEVQQDGHPVGIDELLDGTVLLVAEDLPDADARLQQHSHGGLGGLQPGEQQQQLGLGVLFLDAGHDVLLVLTVGQVHSEGNARYIRLSAHDVGV